MYTTCRKIPDTDIAQENNIQTRHQIIARNIPRTLERIKDQKIICRPDAAIKQGKTSRCDRKEHLYLPETN